MRAFSLALIKRRLGFLVAMVWLESTPLSVAVVFLSLTSLKLIELFVAILFELVVMKLLSLRGRPDGGLAASFYLI